MLDVRVVPAQTRAGLRSSTVRTIETASSLVASPESPITSVRVAHLSLDDELAAVVRALSTRADVRLIVRPCIDGAYLVLERTGGSPREPERRPHAGQWLKGLLGLVTGGHR